MDSTLQIHTCTFCRKSAETHFIERLLQALRTSFSEERIDTKMQVTAHMALVPLSRWHSILWWREWATSCWLPCLKPLNLFSSYTIKVFGLKVLICYMNIFSFNFKSMEFIFTLNFIYGTLSRGRKFHWLKIFLDIEFWIFQIKSIIYPPFHLFFATWKKVIPILKMEF